MPEQVQISHTQWTVGNAQVETEAGVKDAVAIVFTDLITQKTYVFPMPVEEGVEMGEVLKADDTEEAMMAYAKKREARAKLAAVKGMPSNADLRKAQRAGQSGVIQ